MTITTLQLDGPEIKLEFSRISKSRAGALTLVIDPQNGVPCRVAYAISRRKDPEDAICDLRCREGTTRSNIGFLFGDGSRHQARDLNTLDVICAWAKVKMLDVVVWTDLGSNFQSECGKPFKVAAALAYVRSLDAASKARAAEYLSGAPAFIETPLRCAIQALPWFPK